MDDPRWDTGMSNPRAVYAELISEGKPHSLRDELAKQIRINIVLILAAVLLALVLALHK